MKIKNVILSLGLAAAIPFTAYANYDAEEKAEHITKMLNMDQNRAQQVEQVFKNYEEQHKVLKEQKKQRLDSILTDDEMDQLEDMKKAKKDKKHGEWKKN